MTKRDGTIIDGQWQSNGLYRGRILEPLTDVGFRIQTILEGIKSGKAVLQKNDGSRYEEDWKWGRFLKQVCIRPPQKAECTEADEKAFQIWTKGPRKFIAEIPNALEFMGGPPGPCYIEDVEASVIQVPLSRGSMKFHPSVSSFGGLFRIGTLDGLGIIQREEGDYYIGDVEKGKPAGWGLSHVVERKTRLGETVPGETVLGEWSSGNMSGFGCRIFSDDTMYIGESESGKPGGEGFLLKKDEKGARIIYIGNWQSGVLYKGAVFNLFPDGSLSTYSILERQVTGKAYWEKKDGSYAEEDWERNRLLKRVFLRPPRIAERVESAKASSGI